MPSHDDIPHHHRPPDSGSDADAAIGTEVADLVRATADAAHCPSIAWGVTVGGSLVADGFATTHDSPAATTGMPPDAHRSRVYRIASMTKSFTAAAVLSLRDQGALGLDDTIASLAPELAAIRHPAVDAPDITVRQLLSMSSGLATDDAWADRHLDIDDDALTAIYSYGATFAVDPGTAFEYSNLGYSMLGRIIRRITGQRPQDFTTEHILRPLGLYDTTWVSPSHDNWARPYRVEDGAIVADVDPLDDGGIAPMGGLWSTLDDLVTWTRWLSAAMRSGEDDRSVLRRSSRREMQQANVYAGQTARAPLGAEGPTHTTAEGYGFGLRADHDSRHGTMIFHTGGLPGYGSNMRWLPEHDVAVIALANVTYAPMEALTLRILDRLADRAVIAAPDPAPSSALDLASSSLIHLLNGWDDGDARRLFADNVELDESFARRAHAAEHLLAEHGPLRVVSVRPITAARGTVHVAGSDGTSTQIDLELSPHVPPLIQQYSIR